MGDLDHIQRDNIGYNLAMMPHLNDFCSILFQYSGLTTFAYINFCEDKIHHFCNNHAWLTHYVTHQFHFRHGERYLEEIKKIPDHGYHIVLRVKKAEALNDELTECLRNYDIGHGLSLYRRNINSIELFNFATSPQNEKIWEFYLNNLDMLKRFSGFIKHKISPYMKEKKLKTALPSSIDFNMALQQALIKTPPSKEKYAQTDMRVKLSPRELECLMWIAHGKRVKEIARLLNVSPRTVETHINLVQQKLQLSKSAAIDYYWNSDLSWLCAGAKGNR